MQALGSLLFLVLFATIPLVMFGVIAYRVVRWAVVRSGWRGTLRERGWSPDVTRDVVGAALEDVGLPTRRANLSWLATREGSHVAFYRRRRRGRGAGDAKRVLLVPRDTDGPRGALQPRVGGMLEAMALSMAQTFSQAARDFSGWEWALVFPRDATWLDEELSPRLRDFLEPGETLLFGSRWIALSLPDGEMPELLERLDGLRDAFG